MTHISNGRTASPRPCDLGLLVEGEADQHRLQRPSLVNDTIDCDAAGQASLVPGCLVSVFAELTQSASIPRERQSREARGWMRQSTGWYAAVFFAAAQMASAAWGDETAGDPSSGASVEELSPPVVSERIVVTATRSERNADDLPVSASVVRRPEVLEASSDSVRDVVAAVPGVSLAPSDTRTHFPTRNLISMRGIGEGSVLVLLDGIPINDPYQGSIHWNKVPIEDVERIEIVRGAGASLYGNYALGGTINILTRPADRSELGLRGSYGSNETVQTNLGLAWVPSDRWSLSLNYDRFDTDGYIRPIREIRGPIDIPNFSESDNFSLRADLTPSDTTRLRLHASYLDALTSQGTPTSFNTWNIMDLSASGHRAAGRDGALSFSAYYQDQSFDFQNVRLDAARTRETFANATDSDIDATGGSVQWSRSISQAIPFVSAGLDVQRSKAYELRDNYTGGVVSSTQIVGGEKEIVGVFGQISWHPRPRTEVLVSSRIDYWKNSNGFEEQIPGDRTDHGESSTTQLDPRISIRYELTPRSALRGSVYRAFKAPELRDLYRSGGSRGTIALANPNLTPEVLLGADLGVVGSSGRWRGEATVFYNEVDDRVTPVTLQTSPITIIEPRNIASTRSTGLELIGYAQLSRSWSLETGYVFAEAEVTDNPADPTLEGGRIPHIPEHFGTAALLYRGRNGFSASLRGRTQSRTFEDAQNQLPYESHTVFDLGATWPVRGSLDLFVIAENLFDEEYLAEISVDPRRGAPRQIYVGFRLNSSIGRSLGGN